MDDTLNANLQAYMQPVASYAQTGKPINAVNVWPKSPAKVDLVVYQYSRVGMLAEMVRELKNEDIIQMSLK